MKNFKKSQALGYNDPEHFRENKTFLGITFGFTLKGAENQNLILPKPGNAFSTIVENVLP